MSSDDSWIEIPNWHKFQHYSDRRPKWIKVYTSLLDNPDYRALSFRHAGLLHSLWLLYAASDGELPAKPATIAHMCGFPSEWELKQLRRRWVEGAAAVGSERVEPTHGVVEDTVRTRDLKTLERRGFVKLSTTRPLARASSDASLEGELLRSSPKSAPARTRERALRERAREQKPPPAAAVLCPLCGITRNTPDQLADHLRNVHDIEGTS